MKRYHLLMCLGAVFFLASCKESPKIVEPKPVKEQAKESAETKIIKEVTEKVKQLEEDFVPEHIKNSSIKSVVQ